MKMTRKRQTRLSLWMAAIILAADWLALLPSSVIDTDFVKEGKAVEEVWIVESPQPTSEAQEGDSQATSGEDPATLASPGAIVSPQPTELPSTETVEKTNVKKLKKVRKVKLTRFSTNIVRLSWKKQKKASFYRIYRSRKKSGKFHFIGITQNEHFLAKRLKNKKKYYFYIQACKKKKRTRADGPASEIVHIKMKKYTRKTIFAGDSICEGIGMGWSFPQMHTGGKKKTVAYRGLNTVTFHTKKIFDGRTGLQKLISEKPYRAYMMLGMNEIFWRSTTDMITEYQGMIKDIQRACPETDIILCAVSPVTRAEYANHPGMKQIPIFNRKLKKLAKKMDLTYFDYTDFLKDSEGYLKEEYAAADGYHWKADAYVKFGQIVGSFDRSLDH